MIKLKNKSKLPVLFIAIDGHGGSGKSTIANYLSEKLNIEVIHNDDFASWDNPKDWWKVIIKKIFRPIKNGDNLLNYTRSKWWENHNPKPVINQPVTPVMILEGVGSLRREFEPYISYGIFVDTPAELFLSRGFERDRGLDGKSDLEIKSMRDGWNKDEQDFFSKYNPRRRADLIVRGDTELDSQLKDLVLAINEYNLSADNLT